MRPDCNYCFRKNDQIIFKEIDSTPTLVDPYRRTLVKLNPTALAIWQLLDGEHSVTAILETLHAEFDVNAEKLQKDVRGFLSDLARREMIQ
jgi:coenzyme PQQ biosynthesis protein PqqD